MNKLKIALINFLISLGILIVALFDERILVFATIVFASALGIFSYHLLANKVNIKIASTYKHFAIIALLCLLISIPFYFLVVTNTLIIIIGVIFSIGGIVSIILTVKGIRS